MGSLTLQVLDDAPQAVSVGGDDDVLARLDLGSDDVVPERQRAGNGILERLAGGQLTRLQALVAAGLWGV